MTIRQRNALHGPNQTLRFPRSQREAGWYGAEWADKVDGSGWCAAVGWASVGIAITWLFFVLVLGWPL